MRPRWVGLSLALIAGLALGAMLSPPPADAVAKEIIQLQQQVAILLQTQQAMQTQMTQSFTTLKTLLEQALDSTNRLNSTMGVLQKSIQDVQANTGARMDALSSQVQGLADGLEDLKARLGKLSDQVATTQSTVQSLDAKISAASGAQPPGTPGAAPSAAPAGPPPPADLLYSNALRDFMSGNYDLSQSEFQDYLRYYPNTDLASNAHFYLGEIAYQRGHYAEAVAEYDTVLTRFPNSFKRADARLKKAQALLRLNEREAAVRELRQLIRESPGSEQARKAQAQLRALGLRTR